MTLLALQLTLRLRFTQAFFAVTLFTLQLQSLKFKLKLTSPVTLEAIKADKAFDGWDLLRIGRLSVVPTSDKIWNRLIELSSGGKAK